MFFSEVFRICYKNEFLVIENILVLFSNSSLGENELVEFNKIQHFSIKSLNPIQNYSNIVESITYILWIFVVVFLLPINFLVSFGICSTPRLSKYVTLSPLTERYEFLLICSHLDLLYMLYTFIILE